MALQTYSDTSKMDAAISAINDLLIEHGIYNRIQFIQRYQSKLGLRDEPTDRPSAIITTVCKHFGVLPQAVLTHDRSREISFVRQVSCYLIYQMTPLSLTSIGKRLHLHHTSVLHGVRKIEAQRMTDTTLNSFLDAAIATYQDA